MSVFVAARIAVAPAAAAQWSWQQMVPDDALEVGR